jgi:flagellar motor switch/type III secretory pathway protein FliN
MPPEVQRLMRLRVPVIVRFAARSLPIARVRRLSLGTILEFDQSIEQPLALMVNNRDVGEGDPVRSGELYALRLSSIAEPAVRIRSLGK